VDRACELKDRAGVSGLVSLLAWIGIFIVASSIEGAIGGIGGLWVGILSIIPRYHFYDRWRHR
jgi:hypothetical protein